MAFRQQSEGLHRGSLKNAQSGHPSRGIFELRIVILYPAKTFPADLSGLELLANAAGVLPAGNVWIA